MPLLSNWTRGKDAAEKKQFLVNLEAARPVLDRLLEILSEFEEELSEKDIALSEYDSPAYPYLKADRAGERRMLNKVVTLLKSTRE